MANSHDLVGPSRQPTGVSVVIPAWNDAGRLGPTLEWVATALERADIPFEVLVVADGCTDGTKNLVNSYSDRGVGILEFPCRLGKGAAVTEGLIRAKYDKAGFLDADSLIGAECLLQLIARLDLSDGAVASRWERGKKAQFHESRVRNLLSVIWSALTRGLLLTSVRDPQFGAKFFRTQALKVVVRQVTISGWAFDVGLLYHWKATGHSCDEVSAVWRDAPGSKLVISHAVPLMLASLIGFRLMNSPIGRRIPPGISRKLQLKLGFLARQFAESREGRLVEFPGAPTGSDV